MSPKAVISQVIANAVEVEKKVANCIVAPFDTGVGAIPLATVTAKGSLIVGTGNASVAELAKGANGDVVVYDDTQPTGLKASPVEAGAGLPVNGRLTLASGTPVTTTDQTAKTTIYFTPFRGNRIALFTDGVWRVNTFTELSCSLSGLTANKNYDVFVFKDGSTLKLALTVWTNDTTRATAIAMKDGMYTNDAAMTPTAISSGIAGELAQYSALYVGTIRTTGTDGQVEDSYLNRFVWSAYNQIRRPFKIFETTDSWSYTTASWRSWNNNSANRASFVQGLNEEPVRLQFNAFAGTSSGNPIAAIGLDGTTPSALFGPGSSYGIIVATYDDYPGIGAHYLQLLERGGTGVTFYGDVVASVGIQAGALGYIMG